MAKGKPLSILLVEDSEDDAALILRAMRKGGYAPQHQRVELADEMRAALFRQSWDAVLSDYSLPHFNGKQALEVLNASGLDCPFILVSGAIGEETAVELMRLGAKDYILKDKLARLAPAVERELLEVDSRRRRRKAEEALKRSEERFRQLIEHSPMPLAIIYSQGRVEYLNQKFIQLFGYTLADVSSLDDWWPLAFPDPEVRAQAGAQWRQAVETAAKDGSDIPMDECAITCRDGSSRIVEVFGAPIGEKLLVVLNDISERKESEQERKRLEAQLRQSQKMEAIGTLAGGIAHDFNNILASIIGYTELALDAEQHQESLGSELRQVLGAADRAKALVQQILAFSRKAEYDLKPLNLNKIIDSAVKMLSSTISKMIDIELNLDDELGVIRGDANQLEQVLMNLCTNARDAMPNGGQLLITTCNTTWPQAINHNNLELKPGHYLRLSVSDNGHGIPPETLRQIFDPFFTTKDVGKGTGLGLSTVFGIVKSHGGNIACQSQPGLGTDFLVYLPVIDHMAEETRFQPSEAVLPMGRGETVLVVDDEEALREIASRILSQANYRTVQKTNGEEALRIYQQDGREIDLVILDMGMPVMGGQDCLKELLRIDPAVKVVVATGYALDEGLRQVLKSGAAGYVAKPFSKFKLLSIVRKVLDS